MFKVMVKGEEKFMVMLTGPSSYRFGNNHVKKGGTLTVARNTRDYLVKTTGYFTDYDPTPAEQIDELAPPQFGEVRVPRISENDMNPDINPPLTQAQAFELSKKGHDVDQSGETVGAGTAVKAGLGLSEGVGASALPPKSDEGSGDMKIGDLVSSSVKGGATAMAKKKVTIGKKAPAATAEKAAETTAVLVD